MTPEFEFLTKIMVSCSKFARFRYPLPKMLSKTVSWFITFPPGAAISIFSKMVLKRVSSAFELIYGRLRNPDASREPAFADS